MSKVNLIPAPIHTVSTQTALPLSPLVSILTPTWNRAVYLERVWKALSRQTYTNIEWIVANDGSTDETVTVVRELAARSAFPVVLINADIRIGKACMDNKAIAHATGEFILWNDSDDYLVPNAIERLIAVWNQIPDKCREEFIGVTALCATENGMILSALPWVGQFDTSWNDLSEKYHVSGDMLYLVKAVLLKKNPFSEVDYVIPEGVIWTTLGYMKVRLIPEILNIKEYHAANCISFSGKMEYCRGRAYAMATSERNLRIYQRRLTARLWKLITYIRYCIHGEINFREQMHLWAGNSSWTLFLLMWPVGCLLALKDELQGKVRKTHREFVVAQNVVNIVSENLN